MIEAELKARVHDPDTLRARLRRLAGEELSVYRDTYYDRPGRELTAQGRELRVRVMETGGVRRAVLTYKEPAADAASGSKLEHETKVARAWLRAWVAERCWPSRSRTADSTPSAVPAMAGGVAEAESSARSALILSYRASSGAGRGPGSGRRVSGMR